MQYTITKNDSFHSVEINFSGKPSDAIRAALKKAGFRWHGVKKLWYGYKTEDEARAILAGADEAAEAAPVPATVEKSGALTLADLEAITEKYSGLVSADGTGIYSGFTGQNGRGIYGQDLKKAILSELKKNGIKATAREGRGGWTTSFTFTVTVPEAFTISEADYIKAETENRATIRGLCWYYTPDGGSLHRDSLPTDYDERRAILEETARRLYRDAVSHQGEAPVADAFRAAVLAIVTSFNADHSDSQTDYFDRAIYDWYRWKIV